MTRSVIVRPTVWEAGLWPGMEGADFQSLVDAGWKLNPEGPISGAARVSRVDYGGQFVVFQEPIKDFKDEAEEIRREITS